MKELPSLRRQASELEKIEHEHMHKERALLENEDRYKALFDRSSYWIYVHDFKGKFLNANRAALDSLGYTKEDIPSLDFSYLLKKSDLPRVFKAINNIRRKGSQENPVELKFKKKDGSYVWIEAEGSLISRGGKPYAIQTIARDITDRKLAEKALRESEEKFKEIFNYVNDGLVYLNNKGKILEANAKAIRIFGGTKEELIGKHFTKIGLFTPKEIHLLMRKFKNVFTEKTTAINLTIKNKKGKEIHLESYASHRKTKGRPSRVIAVVRDITKRQRVEEALQDSEERYRTLFEGAPDATFLANADTGEIIDANPAASELLKKPREEIVGLHQTELHPPQQEKLAKGIFKQHIQQSKTKKKTFPLEIPVIRSDGKEIPMEIMAQLFQIGGKKILQGVFRDITKRKEVEERIKASLKEKEVLLQEVHHRVKNNMQIISSLHNIQSRYIGDKQAREMFRNTQNRVKSMAIIHERLYQSKNFSRVDFSDYVLSLINHLFMAFGVNREKIKLNIDIKDVFLDINTAIPCGLIINELVSNSLKHAFPDGRKGKIIVAMHHLNGKKVELCVVDNGVGLPKKMDIRKTNSLGLHLVCLLVEDQLHGEIKLNRILGTSFRLKLRTPK